jgi:restriction endonuclease S subunit
MLSLILFVIRAGNKVDTRYLYYYLTQETCIQYFEKVAKQSRALIPGFTVDDLARFEIPLPPFETQKSIGHFLGNVDDLIKLNEYKIATLEELQKVIYKETEAKGRWRMGNLYDVANVHTGKNLDKKRYSKDGYRVYMCGRQIYHYPEYLYETSKIFLMAHGSNTGKVSVSRPKSLITNSVIVIDELKPTYFDFLKVWALNYPFREIFAGELMSQILKPDVKNLKIRIPPEKTLLELHERLAPMNEAEEALREKNDKLAEIKREFSPLLYGNRIRLTY